MNGFSAHRIPLSLVVMLVLACCRPAPAAGATPSAGIELRVLARAVSPGEPLRIEAVAGEPLRSLDATLLGRPIHMTRAPTGGTTGPADRWLGWTLVDLDDPAGDTELLADGRTLDGRPVRAGRFVRVERREYPTEELKVAPQYVDPPPEVSRRRERERRSLAEIFRRRSEFAEPLRTFVRPLAGPPTSVFGTRRVFNGEPRSPHPGLDLRAASGTPVHASGPGVVALAQELYFAGNTVILDHGGGLFTLYAHLSAFDVEAGDRVATGERVGASGATGRVTGPHLHWGAKVGDRPFDPRALTDGVLFP